MEEILNVHKLAEYLKMNSRTLQRKARKGKIPGLDGYQVLERIQESSDVPVLMLTAVHEKAAMAHSLGIGADDFIEKSFLPRVFVARIRAKLRRVRGELRTHQMHNIDGLYVRPGAFSAIRTERRDHGDTRYPE